jgi:hypothetical protein
MVALGRNDANATAGAVEGFKRAADQRAMNSAISLLGMGVLYTKQPTGGNCYIGFATTW